MRWKKNIEHIRHGLASMAMVFEESVGGTIGQERVCISAEIAFQLLDNIFNHSSHDHFIAQTGLQQ
jgi:hypothetical protein